MRLRLTFTMLAFALLSNLSSAAANDYQMMRLFSDLTMARSRANTDQVRANSDAARAMAQANMQNAAANLERVRARQIELETERQEVFLDQTRRDLRLQNRDDLRARKEMKELEKRKSQLSSFFSGRVTPSNAKAFLWSSSRVPFSESFRQYLSREVQALKSAQFQSTMPIFEVLEPSGHLRRPPLCLMGRRGSELYQRRTAFDEIWQRLLNALRYDHELDYDHFLAIDDRMQSWRRASLARELSDRARRDGICYLNRLGSVVRCLETQRGMDRLACLIKNEGFGFSGGTCGQLLQHIQDWSLQVAPGSEAQMILAEYGEACLGSIAEEMTLARNELKAPMLAK